MGAFKTGLKVLAVSVVAALIMMIPYAIISLMFATIILAPIALVLYIIAFIIDIFVIGWLAKKFWKWK